MSDLLQGLPLFINRNSLRRGGVSLVWKIGAIRRVRCHSVTGVHLFFYISSIFIMILSLFKLTIMINSFNYHTFLLNIIIIIHYLIIFFFSTTFSVVTFAGNSYHSFQDAIQSWSLFHFYIICSLYTFVLMFSSSFAQIIAWSRDNFRGIRRTLRNSKRCREIQNDTPVVDDKFEIFSWKFGNTFGCHFTFFNSF